METETVIVLARDQVSFHEFLKQRQEAAGGTRVILDRRESEGSSNGDGPSPSLDRPAGHTMQNECARPRPP